MPPRKRVDSLAIISRRKWASLALKMVKKIEVNCAMDKVKEAMDYLNALPSMIVHQILDTSLELYIDSVKKEEDIVSIIQNGQFVDQECKIPRLSSLFGILVSFNVTHLDFTNLIRLGTLSANAFAKFNQILSECLMRLPSLQYLNLKSPNSRTSLPSVTGDHLKILGQHCPELQYLDISFACGLKNEDLLNLVPDQDHPGCPLLETLYVFDCGFSDKCIKAILTALIHLKDVGYKELGNVLKRISKENGETRQLQLTHINHLGSSRIRKTSISSLRCKKSIIEAIAKLCPKVTNLKARVQDIDVEHLSLLPELNSIELVFNVGRPSTPALSTATYFQCHGANLTSVALICSAISMIHIQMLGKNCPNLNSLWLRSNHFQVTKGGRDELPEEMPLNHAYFQRLKTLYFRVGEGELALSFVPPYVLNYILKNASELKELIIALRSYIVSDDYICGLLIDCQLQQLEKLLIVVPGLNNLPGVIPLTMQTVDFVLDFCPAMKKLGNLLSWDVLKSNQKYELLKQAMKNYDLELICRHMVMH